MAVRHVSLCVVLPSHPPQLCQGMLSLQWLLLVTYNWSISQFERRIERRMHGFILVLAFVVASVPLFFQGYNPQCGVCFLPFPLPLGCGDWLRGDGTTECLRGSTTLATVYVAIGVLSVIATAVFCTGATVGIYQSVYRQDQTIAQHRHGSTHQEMHTKSRNIRTKTLLHTGTYYICWILPAFFIIPSNPQALRLVGSVLIPLMGFLHMLVFLLPKCREHQQVRPGVGLAVAYCHVLLAARTGAGPPAANPISWAVDANVGAEEPHSLAAGEAGEAAAATAIRGGGSPRSRTGSGFLR